MYRCQINVTIFCATGALGISWQHFHDNTIRIYFTRWLSVSCVFLCKNIIASFNISLTHEDGFSKAKNSNIEGAYYSVCDDYGITSDKIWLNGDWFYTTAYDNLGDGGKATKRSTSDNLTHWIITQSKVFNRTGIWKVHWIFTQSKDLCRHTSIELLLLKYKQDSR